MGTKTMESDSRTGTSVMELGHGLGHRAHLVQLRKNYKGVERHQQNYNMTDEDVDSFEEEWTKRYEESWKKSKPADALLVRRHWSTSSNGLV